MGARLRVMIVGVILIGGVIVLIYAGYRFNWPWSGFGPETSEPKQHAKTLWDWLQLLIIPAVLAAGALWFNAQQGKVSDAENKDNQRETALQTYIDKMSELLLKEHLGELTSEGELKLEYEGVRKIARVRTLTILPRLDANRKRSVLQFLYESSLIDKGKCIVNLRGATLHGAALGWLHLSGADLSGADLSGADLSNANLWRADLGGPKLSEAILITANLLGTNLSGADLIGADLSEANLSGADLSGADLSEANLHGAILYGAKLSGAILKDATGITTEQLDKAKSLKGATMPDGSIHP